MKKVIISGYYGFNNTGDEAVLEAMLSGMRSEAAGRGEEILFTVLSKYPAQTVAQHNVTAISRTNLMQIVSALFSCDLFISGGGGLLQDVTGLRLSVAYYLGLVLMARLLGKPAVLYAQGIGPVKRPVNRLLIRMIANRATFITVRDNDSLAELSRMGVSRPPTSLTADPAFLLTPAQTFSAPARSIISQERTKIGIVVRPWQGQTHYLKEIALAADVLAAELDALLVLIPMYHSEDLPVSRELATMLKHDTVILDEYLAPSELLGVICHLDLVLSVRLHALIFAAVAGIPMVGIGYDPKVDAFLQRLGLSSAGKTNEVGAPALIDQAKERWQARASVQKNLLEKRDQLRAQAQQTASMIVDTLFESGERP